MQNYFNEVPVYFLAIFYLFNPPEGLFRGSISFSMQLFLTLGKTTFLKCMKGKKTPNQRKMYEIRINLKSFEVVYGFSGKNNSSCIFVMVWFNDACRKKIR